MKMKSRGHNALSALAQLFKLILSFSDCREIIYMYIHIKGEGTPSCCLAEAERMKYWKLYHYYRANFFPRTPARASLKDAEFFNAASNEP